MSRPALLLVLPLLLAVLLPTEAVAKRSGGSSSAGHSGSPHSSGGHESTHVNEGGTHLSGPLRSGSRHRDGAESASDADGSVSTVVSPEAQASRRQETQAAEEKAYAEAEAARKLESSLLELQRKAEAEKAALAEAEARKRQEAEQREQARLQAAEERRQRQLAWEARCVVRPVMSDRDIATCREVWTRSAPGN